MQGHEPCQVEEQTAAEVEGNSVGLSINEDIDSGRVDLEYAGQAKNERKKAVEQWLQFCRRCSFIAAVVDVNMSPIERNRKSFVQVLPLLAVAVSASVKLCRILVVLRVDILLTGRPTFLDRILDVRPCCLNVAANLRAVGAFVIRGWCWCWCVLETQLFSPVANQTIIYRSTGVVVGKFHGVVGAIAKRTGHLLGPLWSGWWRCVLSMASFRNSRFRLFRCTLTFLLLQLQFLLLCDTSLVLLAAKDAFDINTLLLQSSQWLCQYTFQSDSIVLFRPRNQESDKFL